jgi:hypothetical protein
VWKWGGEGSLRSLCSEQHLFMFLFKAKTFQIEDCKDSCQVALSYTPILVVNCFIIQIQKH